MRIRRIRLEHFRGVAEREVELAPSGVTIVQGPNEVGKSSLADAVDVLFDELHTTTRSSVRDLQPIGRDVGTTVEVDAELGPYRFTYRKTFNRDRQAVLHVHAPSPGTWTGREAHERMEQLLGEHLDVELWRALRTAQGESIAQADLRKTTSLVEALDRAAGTTTTTGVEETLYAMVVAECERYFTPTGRDGTVLKEVDAAVEAAAAEVARRAEAFAAIEDDVARYDRLERRVVELRGTSADARRAATHRQARWREVEAVADTIAVRREVRDHAAERLAALRDRVGARRAVEEELADCEVAVTELGEEVAAAAQPLAEAEAALAQVEADTAAARQAVDRAEAQLRSLARRLDQAHDRRELAALRERLAAVREARERRVAAEAELAAHAVDDTALTRIRAAAHAVELAAAARDAAATAVVVELHGDHDATLDGERVTCTGMAPFEHLVTGRAVLRVGDVATVTIQAGGDADAIEGRHAAATAELDAALADVGQPSVEAAVAAAGERVAAEQRVALARRALADAGDADAFEARIAAIEAGLRHATDTTDGTDGAVPSGSLDPLDVAALRERRDQAEAERRLQVAGRDAAEEARREAQATLHARRDAHDRAARRLAAAEDARARAAARLAAERAERSDDALAEAVQRAEGLLQASEDALGAAHAQLGDADPEAVRALAANAEAAADRAARELQEAEGELREVGARIDVAGEEGRFERLEEARAELAHAERVRTRTRRRAAAARLLHERMTAARDRARRAYLRPLQERIEALGRIAIGADLEVELDDGSLAIDRVVRGGVALPFTSLSVGAQEQLAVVQRLACAMLVARDGAAGVPLVLDDALGFSDPARLEAMGAVLRLAGERCQVLVLTCVPERYRHVGDADVLTLGAPPAAVT